MDTGKYVKGLQHIGIAVTGFQEAVEFLEYFGFQVIRRENQKNGDPVAFMEQAGLVLEVYKDEAAVKRTGTVEHIAMDVEDAEGFFQELSRECGLAERGSENRDFNGGKAGIRKLEPPACLPYWNTGIRYVTVEGPEGLKLEFCEKLK